MKKQEFWRRRSGGYVPVRVVGVGPAGVSVLGTDRSGERFTETVDAAVLHRDTRRAAWMPEVREVARSLVFAAPVAAAVGILVYYVIPLVR